MQAVKQASVEVSENGEEEEEEAEFGEEDLFHQQVKHATPHLVVSGPGPTVLPQKTTDLSSHTPGLSARTPSSQSWGWERRLQSSLGWGQSLWGPVCLLGSRLPNSSPHLCRGTQGLPRGVAG